MGTKAIRLWRIPIIMQQCGLGRLVPDRLYLKCMFRDKMGYKLNLSNPTTFNEKLQWLKIYDRKPVYSLLVDKFEVKQYVSDMIGSEYVIDNYGVWNSFDEIDFATLPDQFVLKCTHNSGGIVICEDKASFDREKAKLFLEKNQRDEYYLSGREWPYKSVRPRILAERYMVDDQTRELRDYKFFSFNGEIKMMFVATNRQATDRPTAFDFFDENYCHLDIRHGHPNAESIPMKPKSFDLMKQLAHKLSVGIPQVRVDFYEVNGKVYFGEMTFFHHCGWVPFDPPEWDTILGSWVSLPSKTK